MLAFPDGHADAADHLDVAAGVGEADVLQLHGFGGLQQWRCVPGVDGQGHKQFVVLEVREVLVDGAQRRHQVVCRGQGPADDLLHVQELAHRLGACDDLPHHPDQRHHFGAVLQGIGGELLRDVPLLEVQPAALVRVPQPGPEIHQVADDPVQPHLGDVLRAQQVGLDHPALAAGVHLGVPVGDLLPGKFELQVDAGHDGDQDDHGDPPAHQQQRADGQNHRHELGEDRGDPVQDPGVGIGEPLGAVVEINGFLVVVPPEFERQEPLVHQVAHDGADLEAHELLDVAVHAAEGTPEQSQCRGDDDVHDGLLAGGGVTGVGGRQRRGGQRCEVGGDQWQRRRDERADHFHHDGGR